MKGTGEFMVTITVNGEKKKYPKGTLYEEIAKEYQPSYKDMIALVIENGKIRELIKPAGKDCELSFLTIRDNIGHKAYVRTATMMLVNTYLRIQQFHSLEYTQDMPYHTTKTFVLLGS